MSVAVPSPGSAPFVAAGTGAVVRTANSKMADTVHIADFGAVADGVTDTAAALAAAIASLPSTGGKIRCGRGTYYFASAVNITGTYSGALEIIGDGTKFKTDKAISILRRRPADQATADSMVTTAIRLEGITFYGTKIAGQKGIELGATYLAEIRNCNFMFLDYGADLQFCLKAKFVACFATDCATYGFVARAGTGIWTGASDNNSQSNHTDWEGCRVACSNGMTAAYAVLASDGCLITDSIAEGENPQYNVLYNSQASTTVKSFAVRNLHSENTPTGAIVYARGSGILLLDRIFFQTAAVMVDAQLGASGCVICREWPYVPPFGTVHFKSDRDVDTRWIFENMGNSSEDYFQAAWWSLTSGAVLYPRGLTVLNTATTELTNAAPAMRGWKLLLEAKDSIWLASLGELNFLTDGGANIGRSNNFRPDKIFAKTRHVSAGGFGGKNDAATTLGAVIKKVPYYDVDGTTLLGYLPIYDAIT